MPFDTAKAGKVMAQLQAERDALEASGETEAAAQISEAIAHLLLAAGVADEPLLAPEQLDQLRRSANTEPNPQRREAAKAALGVELAKIDLHRLIDGYRPQRRAALQKGR